MSRIPNPDTPMRLPLLLALTLVAAPLAAQKATPDTAGVRAAVLDYVEGVYLVAPERIARSVHPSLVKQGMVRTPAGPYAGPEPMNFTGLHRMAGSWNKGGRVDAKTAPKEIAIYDVQDATAVAKLTASWGTDYFLLAKLEGKWMIMQILWQTPMP